MSLTRRLLLGAASLLPAMALAKAMPSKPTATANERKVLSYSDIITKHKAARKEHQMYAWMGDIVYCENMHPIAVFTRNVKIGEMFDPDALQFRLRSDPMPKLGTMKQPCTKCGKDWFRGTNFHFADGWR